MRARFVLLFVVLAALAGAQDKLPRKGFFGAGFAPVTPEVRQQRKLPEGAGVLVGNVFPGTTAEKGGIKAQDVILAINGKPVTSPGDVGSFVTTNPPGTNFEVTVNRDGKEEKLKLTVAAKPNDKGDNYDVIYDHVVSNGHRIRTIVSKPTNVSGKRPVIFLIQGIGYVSQDTPLTGPGGYNRILKAFNDRGYVTVRVDKPGLGDSEGGPANTVDFDRELDAFRQAMKSLGKYDFIDQNNIFIFGHSMGGCQGPIIASEFKVKGLAVYGTVVRTWNEYVVENTRRQASLAGQSHGALDAEMRPFMAAVHFVIDQKMEPAEVKAKYPYLASAVDNFTPDGKTMSGMPLPYWRQCFAYNYGQYWEKLDTNVLAMWGENEFIASQVDHPLIADIVNKKNPGKGKYVLVPQSDHGFFKTTSIEDSFRKWPQPGKEFNPVVIDMLVKWVEEVRAK